MAHPRLDRPRHHRAVAVAQLWDVVMRDDHPARPTQSVEAPTADQDVPHSPALAVLPPHASANGASPLGIVGFINSSSCSVPVKSQAGIWRFSGGDRPLERTSERSEREQSRPFSSDPRRARMCCAPCVSVCMGTGRRGHGRRSKAEPRRRSTRSDGGTDMVRRKKGETWNARDQNPSANQKGLGFPRHSNALALLFHVRADDSQPARKSRLLHASLDEGR